MILKPLGPCDLPSFACFITPLRMFRHPSTTSVDWSTVELVDSTVSSTCRMDRPGMVELHSSGWYTADMDTMATTSRLGSYFQCSACTTQPQPPTCGMTLVCVYAGRQCRWVADSRAQAGCRSCTLMLCRWIMQLDGCSRAQAKMKAMSIS